MVLRLLCMHQNFIYIFKFYSWIMQIPIDVCCVLAMGGQHWWTNEHVPFWPLSYVSDYCECTELYIFCVFLFVPAAIILTAVWLTMLTMATDMPTRWAYRWKNMKKPMIDRPSRVERNSGVGSTRLAASVSFLDSCTSMPATHADFSGNSIASIQPNFH